ncbi:MAG: DUF924 domain-containing protein [Proteobacteria bacterium]|nr:DUF924 domain-containing protein [Pseudomonadota bacterium]
MTTPADVLSYWFGPLDESSYPQERLGIWWGKSTETDAFIRTTFQATLEAIGRGELDWTSSARGRLAQVLVLDQFSRNMHRDQPGMYALDHLAQDLALDGVMTRADADLTPVERSFLYMPFMHAENIALQRLCVRKFQELRDTARPADADSWTRTLDYAVQHRDIVERFGRFPHRNRILGRESTAEELAFLEEPGSSF